MWSNRNSGRSVGAKTARACDNCTKKRARWYCAADDAFLCEACDSSVHLANLLACRHKCVLLKTSSSCQIVNKQLNPLWYHGFKKKTRTPRHQNIKRLINLPKSLEFVWDSLQALVPEVGSEETMWQEAKEEQLLYRVPVFEPFVASGTSNSNLSASVPGAGYSVHGDVVPSDVDLAQFAADVESLLGPSINDESLDMVGLGVCNAKEEGRVKREETNYDMEADKVGYDMEIDDMAKEPFELNVDYYSVLYCEEEEKVMKYEEDHQTEKAFLKLDYDRVMADWPDKRSPWTTGHRPNQLPATVWPEYMSECGYGDEKRVTSDEVREARICRYKEKRSSRLFCKKIRYQVRKFNAENRPRINGRFIKRPA